MGTDIHMIGEVKLPFSKGEWTPFMIPPYLTTRNYKLFAILADVRNGLGIEPISPPKGLPNDMGEITRKWFNNTLFDTTTDTYDENPLFSLFDGSSGEYGESHLTLQELINYEENYCDGYHLKDLIYFLSHYAKDCWSNELHTNKVRVIFNFDS